MPQALPQPHDADLCLRQVHVRRGDYHVPSAGVKIYPPKGVYIFTPASPHRLGRDSSPAHSRPGYPPTAYLIASPSSSYACGGAE